jgi:hypothetical protein
MGGRFLGFCVLALVVMAACSPGSSAPPAARPEARNGQAPVKKPRKLRPAPVLAPPPRYGNKIVERAAEAPLPASPSDG